MSVTVRFAPSPTGYLHVGNIRAALMNWLFARQQGGTFILRLDDTDLERSTEAYAEAIKSDLNWLGLNFDKVFKQSERFASYDAAVEKLKADGRLYPCYETGEELDRKRKMQMARRLPPVYDREGLDLSDAQKAAFEAEGRKPHWRFKLETPARVDFSDLIRGPVSIDMESVSDPILIREDGSYLYTLPSVVDDIDMGITHVVRGEDHVTNSAVQVQIFEALGGTSPEFAHFALLTAADGDGLSKRKGSLSIGALRDEQDIEAMAIVSLLGRLGTSEAIEPFAEMQPLIDGFDFGKFARKAAKFDTNELERINTHLVHHMSYDAAQARLNLADMDAAFWETVRPNLNKLSDVNDWYHIVKGPIEPVIEDAAFMAQAADLFPAGEITEATWSQWTNAVKDATGAKGKGLFMPLRQALTGQSHGPELKTLLPLIGETRIRARLAGNAA